MAENDPPSAETVDDLASLMHLDEASMLENLRTRYVEDRIYTYVGDILVAVNPFKKLDLYGSEVTRLYCGLCTGVKPSPHIYAIAESCYCAMSQSGRSQCCVISGESGAGKTESTKFLINHLIQLCPQKTASGLEQKILMVNPLLEAFGNARTLMNNNSSRFGKYIQVKFKGRQVIGAKISEYLLERSRVAVQGWEEGNFHVFYYMFAGLSVSELSNLCLDTARNCRYMKRSWETIERNHSQLKEEFGNLVNAMDMVGFTMEDQSDMFRALATVLALGNVDIVEDDAGYAQLSNERILVDVAALLGVQASILDGYFTTKETLTAGEIITTKLTKEKAQDGRDAMAKVMYGRMFSWIILRVNGLLAPKENIQAPECSEIGILDIFGFEHFEKNNFEQLCINLANEKIQYFFNEHIFFLEQQEYAKEGVDWNEIPFIDNRPLLEMFLSKPAGLFALLDEQSIFPRATDFTYVQKLEEKFKSSKYFVSGHDPKYPDAPQFTIVHYAGKVHYLASGFLEKNRDSLPTGAVELFQASTNDLVHEIFMGSVTRTGTLAVKSRRRKSGKARVSRKRKGEETFGRSRTATGRRGLTVSTQFKNSLNLLMEKMFACTPHFVRCIKPNTGKKPGVFEEDFVLSQLRYTGMLETTRIRREGFAIRPSFEEFVSRFKSLANLQIRPDAKGCRRILNAAGITGFQIGKTKVFLKYYHLDTLSRKLERVHRAATVLQKVIRGHVSRKGTRPLFIKARQEREMLQAFVRIISESSARIGASLSSHCRQDSERPAPSMFDEHGAEPMSTFDLPPPPSTHELEANLVASTTISSDSSSGEDEEEQLDGFDIDEVQPVPEQWKPKYKHFGKEGTRAASLRWFRETQAPTAGIKQADGQVSQWFHGIISRRQAEQLLVDQPLGSFLIRVSETRFGYSLSFRSINRCKHFMIDQTASGKYLIVGECRAHPGLKELISFHKKVPVCGIPGDFLTTPCGQSGARLDYDDLLMHGPGSTSSSRNPSPAPPPVKPKTNLPRDSSGEFPSRHQQQRLPPAVPRKTSNMRPGSSVEDLLSVDMSAHLQSSPPSVVKQRTDSWKKSNERLSSGGGGGQRGPSGRMRSASECPPPPSGPSKQRVWPPPAGDRGHAARPVSTALDSSSHYPQHHPQHNHHQQQQQRQQRQSEHYQVQEHGLVQPRPLSLDQSSQSASTERQQQQYYHSGVQDHGMKRSSGHMHGSQETVAMAPLTTKATASQRSRSGSEIGHQSSLTVDDPNLRKQRSAGELWRHSSSSASSSLQSFEEPAPPPPVPKSSRPNLNAEEEEEEDGYSEISDELLGDFPAPPPELITPHADDLTVLAKPKLILQDSDSDDDDDFGDAERYEDIDEPISNVNARAQKANPRLPSPASTASKQSARGRRQKFGSSRRHSQTSAGSRQYETGAGAAPQVPRSSRPAHLRADMVSQSFDSAGISPSHLRPMSSEMHRGPSPPPPVEDIISRHVHTPGTPAPPVPKSSRPALTPPGPPAHSSQRSPRSSPPPVPDKHIINNMQASHSRGSMLSPDVDTRPRSKTSGELLSPIHRPPQRIRSKTKIPMDEEDEYLVPRDELLPASTSKQPPPLPGETLDYRKRQQEFQCRVSSSVPVRFGEGALFDDDFFAEDSTTDLFEDDTNISVPVEMLRSQQNSLRPQPSSLSIPEEDFAMDGDVYCTPEDGFDQFSTPVYLAVADGEDPVAPPPPIPDRNYSKRDLDKSLDTDIHRYKLLLKEEQMQLKMITWRLADHSLNADDYAVLVKRENKCKSKIISFEHMLASLEVSKTGIEGTPGQAQAEAIVRGTPPAARRNTDARSSALRSGSTLSKRINAKKQQRQQRPS
eukprot:scpid22251/ scgid9621/ Myosin-IIIa